MELQRFVLESNLRLLRRQLPEAGEDLRRQLRRLIVTAERELALFDAGEVGACNCPDKDCPDLENARSRTLDWFRGSFNDAATPASLIDPGPGLMIVDVNPIYAAATGVTPSDIAGRPLFAAFPDRSDDPQATGVANLYASLRRVAETGVSEAMPVQRYDTRDPDDGTWRKRYWRIENSALKDDAGRLLYLLHLAAEVDAPN
jgi:PAS domain-containing protein